MTELGSGIRLDSDFDVTPGDGGDLDNSDGIEEVGKDMSLVVVEVLTTGSTEKLPDVYDTVTVPDSISPDYDPDTGDLVETGGVPGSIFGEGLLRDIEVLVANLIDIHGAVDTVTFVEAQREEGDGNTVTVVARVLLTELDSGSQFEFVIRPS